MGGGSHVLCPAVPPERWAAVTRQDKMQRAGPNAGRGRGNGRARANVWQGEETRSLGGWPGRAGAPHRLARRSAARSPAAPAGFDRPKDQSPCSKCGLLYNKMAVITCTRGLWSPTSSIASNLRAPTHSASETGSPRAFIFLVGERCL